MIPKIIHRTTVAEPSDEAEHYWAQFGDLYAGTDWELRSWTEPLDPAEFPLTARLWPRCQNGAQKAGLVRLELLWRFGGVYVDSDVEPVNRFDPLTTVPLFAGWEDETTIPDAVLGAVPKHPVIKACINEAARRIRRNQNAWYTGPGVVTRLLPKRGALLLPPGAFYPYHYLAKTDKVTAETAAPWVYCIHHWAGSWLTEDHHAEIKERQR